MAEEALTVPGRAHELVQHGAHLGLRRHLERGGGPARPGRVTPTAAYKARGAAGARPCPSRHGRGRSPAAAEGGGSGYCPRPVFPAGSRAGSTLGAGPVPPHAALLRSLPRPPRARAGGNGNPRARALRRFVRSATSARTGLGALPLATTCAARPVTHRASRLLIGPPGRALWAR